MDNQSVAYATAFSTGLCLHIFVFRRGEWDAVGSNVVLAFALVYAVLLAAGGVYLRVEALDDLMPLLRLVSPLFLYLLCGLFLSAFLYRLFFHPLRSFPGPLGAKVSATYATRLALKNLHYFEEAKKLHQKYGDFVRVGPNELSIIHPKAVSAIHSNSSPCSKGPFYNSQLPSRSLQTTRDKADHARRRKVWDQGFSAKALRDYEPRVQHYTSQLLARIQTAATNSEPIDVSKAFNLYSFDVMGNLAFGKDFGLVASQQMHPSMRLLQGTTALVGMLGHMVWLLLLMKNFPGVTASLKNFEKWLDQQTKERMMNEPDIPDVFSWVLRDYNTVPKPTAQQFLDLKGDAMLIVVAGSDTTAATLTCLFLSLALHAEKLRRLQAEVDEYFAQQDTVSHQSLAKLPYLQACIDESLRLYPPVPSGVQRQTPPEGLRIDDTFIPGNSIVQIPTYALYRDDRVFRHPDEFIPERWLTQPELVNDKTAFAPFSIGRYSCVGKQLALMEIRSVTAQILQKYNVGLVDDNAEAVFLEGMVDGFTLTCPELKMVFTPRSR